MSELCQRVADFSNVENCTVGGVVRGGLVFEDMDTSFFLETKTLIPRFNSDTCF